jgi:ferrous iron transport protein A
VSHTPPTAFAAMSAPVKLSELAVGAGGTVHSYPKAGAAFLRLREMGLLPGTPLTLVRAAPLGDPLEIKVRGYHLTLRRSEAEHVLVEKAEGLKG